MFEKNMIQSTKISVVSVTFSPCVAHHLCILLYVTNA